METSNIKIYADYQRLTVRSGVMRYASDTVNYVRAEFELGNGWQGFDAVQAIWKSRYDTVSILLDEHGVCMVPQEVLARRSRVQVNLVGFTASGGTLTARLTSYPAFVLDVDVKAELYGSRPEEITPTQFERFVSQVAETARLASESASNASESADRAQASASAAATSEISALNSMTAASNSELSASESALSASGSADTASENALDASNSADSAEASAQSASQSAQAASESAQSASTDATRAETARAFLEGVSADATTLAPGSQATASYDEGVFSFGIPQGLKGDTGAQGPKGDKGDKGDSIKGDKGDKGDKGAAFTYADFTPSQLADLKGPKGDKGDKGDSIYLQFYIDSTPSSRTYGHLIESYTDAEDTSFSLENGHLYLEVTE